MSKDDPTNQVFVGGFVFHVCSCLTDRLNPLYLLSFIKHLPAVLSLCVVFLILIFCVGIKKMLLSFGLAKLHSLFNTTQRKA